MVKRSSTPIILFIVLFSFYIGAALTPLPEGMVDPVDLAELESKTTSIVELEDDVQRWEEIQIDFGGTQSFSEENLWTNNVWEGFTEFYNAQDVTIDLSDIRAISNETNSMSYSAETKNNESSYSLTPSYTHSDVSLLMQGKDGVTGFFDDFDHYSVLPPETLINDSFIRQSDYKWTEKDIGAGCSIEVGTAIVWQGALAMRIDDDSITDSLSLGHLFETVPDSQYIIATFAVRSVSSDHDLFLIIGDSWRANLAFGHTRDGFIAYFDYGSASWIKPSTYSVGAYSKYDIIIDRTTYTYNLYYNDWEIGINVPIDPSDRFGGVFLNTSDSADFTSPADIDFVNVIFANDTSDLTGASFYAEDFETTNRTFSIEEGYYTTTWQPESTTELVEVGHDRGIGITSGNYQGRFNFTDDPLGSFPSYEWTDPSPSGYSPFIVSNKSYHRKALELKDIGSGYCAMNDLIDPVGVGDVEFWAYLPSQPHRFFIVLRADSIAKISVYFDDGHITATDHGSSNAFVGSYAPDQWLHVRIYFEPSISNGYNIYLNGTLAISGLIINPAVGNYISSVFFYTGTTESGFSIFLDSIDYSWEYLYSNYRSMNLYSSSYGYISLSAADNPFLNQLHFIEPLLFLASFGSNLTGGNNVDLTYTLEWINATHTSNQTKSIQPFTSTTISDKLVPTSWDTFDPGSENQSLNRIILEFSSTTSYIPFNFSIWYIRFLVSDSLSYPLWEGETITTIQEQTVAQIGDFNTFTIPTWGFDGVLWRQWDDLVNVHYEAEYYLDGTPAVGTSITFIEPIRMYGSVQSSLVRLYTNASHVLYIDLEGDTYETSVVLPAYDWTIIALTWSWETHTLSISVENVQIFSMDISTFAPTINDLIAYSFDRYRYERRVHTINMSADGNLYIDNIQLWGELYPKFESQSTITDHVLLEDDFGHTTNLYDGIDDPDLTEWTISQDDLTYALHSDETENLADDFEDYTFTSDMLLVWGAVTGTGCSVELGTEYTPTTDRVANLTDTSTAGGGDFALLYKIIRPINRRATITFNVTPYQTTGELVIRLIDTDTGQYGPFVFFNDDGFIWYGNNHISYNSGYMYSATDQRVEIDYEALSRTYTFAVNGTTIVSSVRTLDHVFRVDRIDFVTGATHGSGFDFFSIDDVSILVDNHRHDPIEDRFDYASEQDFWANPNIVEFGQYGTTDIRLLEFQRDLPSNVAHLFDDDGTSYCAIQYETERDLSVYARVWVYPLQTTGVLTINPRNESWHGVQLFMDSDGVFKRWQDGVGVVSSGVSYSADTWYKIEIYGSVQTQEWSAYANNVELFKEVPFSYDEVRYLSRLSIFTSSASVGEFYIDDIYLGVDSRTGDPCIELYDASNINDVEILRSFTALYTQMYASFYLWADSDNSELIIKFKDTTGTRNFHLKMGEADDEWYFASESVSVSTGETFIPGRWYFVEVFADVEGQWWRFAIDRKYIDWMAWYTAPSYNISQISFSTHPSEGVEPYSFRIDALTIEERPDIYTEESGANVYVDEDFESFTSTTNMQTSGIYGTLQTDPFHNHKGIEGSQIFTQSAVDAIAITLTMSVYNPSAVIHDWYGRFFVKTQTDDWSIQINGQAASLFDLVFVNTGRINLWTPVVGLLSPTLPKWDTTLTQWHEIEFFCKGGYVSVRVNGTFIYNLIQYDTSLPAESPAWFVFIDAGITVDDLYLADRPDTTIDDAWTVSNDPNAFVELSDSATLYSQTSTSGTTITQSFAPTDQHLHTTIWMQAHQSTGSLYVALGNPTTPDIINFQMGNEYAPNYFTLNYGLPIYTKLQFPVTFTVNSWYKIDIEVIFKMTFDLLGVLCFINNSLFGGLYIIQDLTLSQVTIGTNATTSTYHSHTINDLSITSRAISSKFGSQPTFYATDWNMYISGYQIPDLVEGTSYDTYREDGETLRVEAYTPSTIYCHIDIPEIFLDPLVSYGITIDARYKADQIWVSGLSAYNDPSSGFFRSYSNYVTNWQGIVSSGRISIHFYGQDPEVDYVSITINTTYTATDVHHPIATPYYLSPIYDFGDTYQLMYWFTNHTASAFPESSRVMYSNDTYHWDYYEVTSEQSFSNYYARYYRLLTKFTNNQMMFFRMAATTYKAPVTELEIEFDYQFDYLQGYYEETYDPDRTVSIWEDSFDEYDDIPSYYYPSDVGFTDVSISTLYSVSGSKSVRFYDNNASEFANIHALFEPMYTYLHTGFYVRASQNYGGFRIQMGNGTYGLVYIDMGNDDDHWWVADDLTMKDTGVSYVADQWYKVEIYVNIEARSYYVVVDDEVIAENVRFWRLANAGPVNFLNILWFTTFSASGLEPYEYFIDSLVVQDPYDIADVHRSTINSFDIIANYSVSLPKVDYFGTLYIYFWHNSSWVETDHHARFDDAYSFYPFLRYDSLIQLKLVLDEPSLYSNLDFNTEISINYTDFSWDVDPTEVESDFYIWEDDMEPYTDLDSFKENYTTYVPGNTNFGKIEVNTSYYGSFFQSIELEDNHPSEWVEFTIEREIYNTIFLDFWVRFNVTSGVQFTVYFESDLGSFFAVRFQSGGTITVSTGGGYSSSGLSFTATDWYHIEIQMDMISNSGHLEVNDTISGTPITWHGTSTPREYCNRTRFATGTTQEAFSVLIDDFSIRSRIIGMTHQTTNYPYSVNGWTEDNSFYDFTLDADLSDPSGWLVTEGASTSINVYSVIGGRTKVVDFTDGNPAALCYMEQDFTAQVSGSISFYLRSTLDVGNNNFGVYFGNDIGNIKFIIMIATNDWRYWDGASYALFWENGFADNTWYHVRISFNCLTDTLDIYINNVLRGNDLPFYNTATDFDYIRFTTWNSATGLHVYLDTIDYSWTDIYPAYGEHGNISSIIGREYYSLSQAWENTTDTPNTDVIYDCAIDSQGNLVAVGRTLVSGQWDTYIIKYDPQGTILWTQSWDSGVSDNDWLEGVAIGYNDYIFVCGTQRPVPVWTTLVQVYDPNGNWKATGSYYTGSSIGMLRDIDVEYYNGNEYILTIGAIGGAVDTDLIVESRTWDGSVLTLTGAALWQGPAETSPPYYLDQGWACDIVRRGTPGATTLDQYIVGETYDISAVDCMALMKIPFFGIAVTLVPTWVQYIYDAGTGEPFDMQADQQGYLYITGRGNSDADTFLTKYLANSKIWYSTYHSGSQGGRKIALTDDNQVFIATMQSGTLDAYGQHSGIGLWTLSQFMKDGTFLHSYDGVNLSAVAGVHRGKNDAWDVTSCYVWGSGTFQEASMQQDIVSRKYVRDNAYTHKVPKDEWTSRTRTIGLDCTFNTSVRGTFGFDNVEYNLTEYFQTIRSIEFVWWLSYQDRSDLPVSVNAYLYNYETTQWDQIYYEEPSSLASHTTGWQNTTVYLNDWIGKQYIYQNREARFRLVYTPPAIYTQRLDHVEIEIATIDVRASNLVLYLPKTISHTSASRTATPSSMMEPVTWNDANAREIDGQYTHTWVGADIIPTLQFQFNFHIIDPLVSLHLYDFGFPDTYSGGSQSGTWIGAGYVDIWNYTSRNWDTIITISSSKAPYLLNYTVEFDTTTSYAYSHPHTSEVIVRVRASVRSISAGVSAYQANIKLDAIQIRCDGSMYHHSNVKFITSAENWQHTTFTMPNMTANLFRPTTDVSFRLIGTLSYHEILVSSSWNAYVMITLFDSADNYLGQWNNSNLFEELIINLPGYLDSLKYSVKLVVDSFGSVVILDLIVYAFEFGVLVQPDEILLQINGLRPTPTGLGEAQLIAEFDTRVLNITSNYPGRLDLDITGEFINRTRFPHLLDSKTMKYYTVAPFDIEYPYVKVYNFSATNVYAKSGTSSWTEMSFFEFGGEFAISTSELNNVLATSNLLGTGEYLDMTFLTDLDIHALAMEPRDQVTPLVYTGDNVTYTQVMYATRPWQFYYFVEPHPFNWLELSRRSNLEVIPVVYHYGDHYYFNSFDCISPFPDDEVFDAQYELNPGWHISNTTVYQNGTFIEMDYEISTDYPVSNVWCQLYGAPEYLYWEIYAREDLLVESYYERFNGHFDLGAITGQEGWTGSATVKDDEYHTFPYAVSIEGSTNHSLPTAERGQIELYTYIENISSLGSDISLVSLYLNNDVFEVMANVTSGNIYVNADGSTYLTDLSLILQEWIPLTLTYNQTHGTFIYDGFDEYIYSTTIQPDKIGFNSTDNSYYIDTIRAYRILNQGQNLTAEMQIYQDENALQFFIDRITENELSFTIHGYKIDYTVQEKSGTTDTFIQYQIDIWNSNPPLFHNTTVRIDTATDDYLIWKVFENLVEQDWEMDTSFADYITITVPDFTDYHHTIYLQGYSWKYTQVKVEETDTYAHYRVKIETNDIDSVNDVGGGVITVDIVNVLDFTVWTVEGEFCTFYFNMSEDAYADHIDINLTNIQTSPIYLEIEGYEFGFETTKISETTLQIYYTNRLTLPTNESMPDNAVLYSIIPEAVNYNYWTLTAPDIYGGTVALHDNTSWDFTVYADRAEFTVPSIQSCIDMGLIEEDGFPGFVTFQIKGFSYIVHEPVLVTSTDTMIAYNVKLETDDIGTITTGTIISVEISIGTEYYPVELYLNNINVTADFNFTIEGVNFVSWTIDAVNDTITIFQVRLYTYYTSQLLLRDTDLLVEYSYTLSVGHPRTIENTIITVDISEISPIPFRIWEIWYGTENLTATFDLQTAFDRLTLTIPNFTIPTRTYKVFGYGHSEIITQTQSIDLEEIYQFRIETLHNRSVYQEEIEVPIINLNEYEHWEVTFQGVEIEFVQTASSIIFIIPNMTVGTRIYIVHGYSWREYTFTYNNIAKYIELKTEITVLHDLNLTDKNREVAVNVEDYYSRILWEVTLGNETINITRFTSTHIYFDLPLLLNNTAGALEPDYIFVTIGYSYRVSQIKQTENELLEQYRLTVETDHAFTNIPVDWNVLTCYVTDRETSGKWYWEISSDYDNFTTIESAPDQIQWEIVNLSQGLTSFTVTGYGYRIFPASSADDPNAFIEETGALIVFRVTVEVYRIQAINSTLINKDPVFVDIRFDATNIAMFTTWRFFMNDVEITSIYNFTDAVENQTDYIPRFNFSMSTTIFSFYIPYVNETQTAFELVGYRNEIQLHLTPVEELLSEFEITITTNDLTTIETVMRVTEDTRDEYDTKISDIQHVLYWELWWNNTLKSDDFNLAVYSDYAEFQPKNLDLTPFQGQYSTTFYLYAYKMDYDYAFSYRNQTYMSYDLVIRTQNNNTLNNPFKYQPNIAIPQTIVDPTLFSDNAIDLTTEGLLVEIDDPEHSFTQMEKWELFLTDPVFENWTDYMTYGAEIVTVLIPYLNYSGDIIYELRGYDFQVLFALNNITTQIGEVEISIFSVYEFDEYPVQRELIFGLNNQFNFSGLYRVYIVSFANGTEIATLSNYDLLYLNQFEYNFPETGVYHLRGYNWLILSELLWRNGTYMEAQIDLLSIYPFDNYSLEEDLVFDNFDVGDSYLIYNFHFGNGTMIEFNITIDRASNEFSVDLPISGTFYIRGYNWIHDRTFMNVNNATYNVIDIEIESLTEFGSYYWLQDPFAPNSNVSIASYREYELWGPNVQLVTVNDSMDVEIFQGDYLLLVFTLLETDTWYRILIDDKISQQGRYYGQTIYWWADRQTSHVYSLHSGEIPIYDVNVTVEDEWEFFVDTYSIPEVNFTDDFSASYDFDESASYGDTTGISIYGNYLHTQDEANYWRIYRSHYPVPIDAYMYLYYNFSEYLGTYFDYMTITNRYAAGGAIAAGSFQIYNNATSSWDTISTISYGIQTDTVQYTNWENYINASGILQLRVYSGIFSHIVSTGFFQWETRYGYSAFWYYSNIDLVSFWSNISTDNWHYAQIQTDSNISIYYDTLHCVGDDADVDAIETNSGFPNLRMIDYTLGRVISGSGGQFNTSSVKIQFNTTHWIGLHEMGTWDGIIITDSELVLTYYDGTYTYETKWLSPSVINNSQLSIWALQINGDYRIDVGMTNATHTDVVVMSMQIGGYFQSLNATVRIETGLHTITGVVISVIDNLSISVASDPEQSDSGTVRVDQPYYVGWKLYGTGFYRVWRNNTLIVPSSVFSNGDEIVWHSVTEHLSTSTYNYSIELNYGYGYNTHHSFTITIIEAEPNTILYYNSIEFLRQPDNTFVMNLPFYGEWSIRSYDWYLQKEMYVQRTDYFRLDFYVVANHDFLLEPVYAFDQALQFSLQRLQGTVNYDISDYLLYKLFNGSDYVMDLTVFNDALPVYFTNRTGLYSIRGYSWDSAWDIVTYEIGVFIEIELNITTILNIGTIPFDLDLSSQLVLIDTWEVSFSNGTNIEGTNIQRVGYHITFDLYVDQTETYRIRGFGVIATITAGSIYFNNITHFGAEVLVSGAFETNDPTIIILDISPYLLKDHEIWGIMIDGVKRTDITILDLGGFTYRFTVPFVNGSSTYELFGLSDYYVVEFLGVSTTQIRYIVNTFNGVTDSIRYLDLTDYGNISSQLWELYFRDNGTKYKDITDYGDTYLRFNVSIPSYDPTSPFPQGRYTILGKDFTSYITVIYDTGVYTKISYRIVTQFPLINATIALDLASIGINHEQFMDSWTVSENETYYGPAIEYALNKIRFTVTQTVIDKTWTIEGFAPIPFATISYYSTDTREVQAGIEMDLRGYLSFSKTSTLWYLNFNPNWSVYNVHIGNETYPVQLINSTILYFEAIGSVIPNPTITDGYLSFKYSPITNVTDELVDDTTYRVIITSEIPLGDLIFTSSDLDLTERRITYMDKGNESVIIFKLVEGRYYVLYNIEIGEGETVITMKLVIPDSANFSWGLIAMAVLIVVVAAIAIWWRWRSRREPGAKGVIQTINEGIKNNLSFDNIRKQLSQIELPSIRQPKKKPRTRRKSSKKKSAKKSAKKKGSKKK
jgi:hypothetical protein